jgi:hypothetical protein
MNPLMQATVTIGIAAFLLFAILGIAFPQMRPTQRPKNERRP